MKNLAILLIICSIPWACTVKPAAEEQHESSNEEVISTATITAADSAYVIGIIKELKGIEMFGVGESFEMMASLLAYKEDSTRYQKVYDILQKRGEYIQTYSIRELDLKNGYFVFAPNGAEVTYTLVYWNMKDGSQLLATEAWECGPVCSSGIYFTRYKDGVFEEVANNAVIPEIERLPKMLVPEYNPDDTNADPIEFKYVLPKKGKNIRYCIDEKCIELAWNEGTFKVM